MDYVTMSEKGQITIPLGIRKKLKIAKGDPLIVHAMEDGSIILRIAAVMPIEIYSKERMDEFAKEDRVTAAEEKQFKRLLGEHQTKRSSHIS